MAEEPISKADLHGLFRQMQSGGPFPKSDKPLVADVDDNNVVTLSDPDTGQPRIWMPLEDFKALRAYKPPVWRKEDPRFTLYKRANIVIVRPRASGIDRAQSCVASVETKHGYYIHTGFEKPYHRVGEGDDWPEDWQWARAPGDKQ